MKNAGNIWIQGAGDLASGVAVRLVRCGYRVVMAETDKPLAVRRLLELLARAPGRRVAVLGEMYELGDLAPEAHRHCTGNHQFWGDRLAACWWIY